MIRFVSQSLRYAAFKVPACASGHGALRAGPGDPGSRMLRSGIRFQQMLEVIVYPGDADRILGRLEIHLVSVSLERR